MLASWSFHPNDPEKAEAPDCSGVVQRKIKWMRRTERDGPVGREDLPEKAALDQSPEGARCEEVTRAKIWGKALQAEQTASARVLRQDGACVLQGKAWRPVVSGRQ